MAQFAEEAGSMLDEFPTKPAIVQRAVEIDMNEKRQRGPELPIPR